MTVEPVTLLRNGRLSMRKVWAHALGLLVRNAGPILLAMIGPVVVMTLAREVMLGQIDRSPDSIFVGFGDLVSFVVWYVLWIGFASVLHARFLDHRNSPPLWRTMIWCAGTDELSVWHRQGHGLAYRGGLCVFDSGRRGKPDFAHYWRGGGVDHAARSHGYLRGGCPSVSSGRCRTSFGPSRQLGIDRVFSSASRDPGRAALRLCVDFAASGAGAAVCA